MDRAECGRCGPRSLGAEIDSASGSGSGSEFTASARGETFTSIQGRKGSVLDQVRINVSGGNTSSYNGGSSDEGNDDVRSSTPNREDSAFDSNSNSNANSSAAPTSTQGE